jgi:hypothetical protein
VKAANYPNSQILKSPNPQILKSPLTIHASNATPGQLLMSSPQTAYMRKLLICLLACFALSCKKGELDAVMVKIVNETSAMMENVKIGDISYGNIEPGNSAGYLEITFPMYAPNCQFSWLGAAQWPAHGYCGSPEPTPIGPGYYTYTIKEFGAPQFLIEVVKD